MSSSPLISVIMGIYNCEEYLDKAIESVLKQTYTNWQMIMCDDCSTDNTYQVAQRYVERYPEKFILIKNDSNKGLNTTLNCCLSLAQGEYIARMDGDDLCAPDRLEKELMFLEENPQYDIVSTRMLYFDENGVFGTSKGINEPDLKSIAKGTPHCHAPCMVRKSAYDLVGGYTEDKKLLRMEDYHLWIKMYSRGCRGYNLPEALYMMRDDRNATNRRKFKYRINEAYVHYLAVKMLNLPKFNYIYMIRPIIVGLLPVQLYDILHKKRLE